MTRLCDVFVNYLLWVVLAGRESKTTCRGDSEGLFWVFVCDFAGVHLALGCIRKSVRRVNYAWTSNKQADGQRGDGADV
jgi:hypothetical protein